MKHQRAFTLVELSIVLVILGLLIGGVLTGQSLIRAAELRSISTQYSRFVTATHTFRDKYFALPGDMPNATAYWGAADGSTGLTAACKTTASTNALTCNGNADGQIRMEPTASNERYRYWQHLANAGLIEGSYSGISTFSTSGTAPSNAPVGRLSGSQWFANYYASQSGHANLFNGQYDNSLELGGFTLNQHPITPLLKPEEMYNIDVKMDDGKPAIGKLVPYSYVDCTDAANSAEITANYALATNAASCVLVFRQLF